MKFEIFTWMQYIFHPWPNCLTTQMVTDAIHIWPVAQLLNHTTLCKMNFRTFSSTIWGFVGNVKHCITRNTSFSGFETYLLTCMEKKSIAPQSWGHQILFVSISHVIYKNHLTKCKISLLVFLLWFRVIYKIMWYLWDF